MNLENEAYYNRFMKELQLVETSKKMAKSVLTRYITFLESKGTILPDATQQLAEEFVSNIKHGLSVRMINKFYSWLNSKFPDSVRIRLKYKSVDSGFTSRYVNIPCRKEVMLLFIPPRTTMNKRLRLMYTLWNYLLVEEGVTPTEIANLRISDYNRSTSVLTVTSKVGKKRAVPVSTWTATKLTNWIKNYAQSDDKMFVRKSGVWNNMPYKSQNITKYTVGVLNAWIGQSEAFTVHNIKQSAALRMHAEGLDIKTISQRLGIARDTIYNLIKYGKFREDRSVEMLSLLVKHANKVWTTSEGKTFIQWRRPRYSARHLARIRKRKLETYNLGGENGLSYTVEW